ncbi:hypothetical protein HJC23_006330 [Cyclotella cryptica]|uniref:Nuclear pore complex protein n=1 Tax=Cyclotella cryptica TaxID=29204 RepID=A0ABD3Q3F6_9STRA|eukprot:CCRYP_008728-RA/>CCRYP_008728-RA protein AED:0.00 eAED:-0.00 QI:0/-1/0/1/-1/1/1/0/420
MKVPSSLLLHYFETAFKRLQNLIDIPPPQHDDDALPTTTNGLDRHRSRIIQAQITSLDETLAEWTNRHHDSSIDRETVQLVLRQVGEGNFSSISFDATNDYQSQGGRDQEVLITQMMDKTNDMARKAFSHLVLYVEWQFDHGMQSPAPSPGFNLRGRDTTDTELDRSSILEYCALMISAVRLDSVQEYLCTGGELFSSAEKTGVVPNMELDTVDSRLVYIQHLIWRALGWDPDFASRQLLQFFSENEECNHDNSLMADENVVETLTKYASSMAVAISNATTTPNTDDGTTRIVNVSYSEKIVSVPYHSMNDDHGTIHSLSAPTSHSIHEHSTTQQRHQLDIAQKTSLLQQQIWEEFELLSPSEQTKTLERAEVVQKEFLEKVMNTPPGPERVVMMQNMDEDAQRSLVIYKLWCSRKSSGE